MTKFFLGVILALAIATPTGRQVSREMFAKAIEIGEYLANKATATTQEVVNGK